MKIKPFRAFRFDEKVVGDVGKCIAPPYDVINTEQQQQLYEESEYNIVRIIKGKTSSSDNQDNNQYTRAAEHLSTWLQKGALKQDQDDTLYAYVQDFEVSGVSFQRLSFIALARLEEFGEVVRPHEQTLNAPMVDRLNLKRATGAKFGLPFCLYEDRQNIAEKIIIKTAGQQPLIDFHNNQNIRHRLFAISDRDDIEKIVKTMSEKGCIIADGHHRYTTGLTYSKENPNPAARYQMLAFSNTCHEGLIILATHRLVGNLGNFGCEEFIAALKADFEVAEYHFDSARSKSEARDMAFVRIRTEHDNDKNAFVIYCGNNAFYVAVLKDKRAMDSAASNMSAAWRSLDVSVLQKLILEKVLNIGQKQIADGSNIEYIKDIGSAVERSIEAVDGGGRQLVFFLNPTRMQQIQMVTAAGERMPQKSTYFYPKIYTGLTINKL